jgi:hypothetical protein
MKKYIGFIAWMVLMSSSIFAQTNPDAANLEVVVGGTFAKPKIIPGLTKLAIAQITISYKLTSTGKVIGKEKSTGQMAGAKLTAFLETTDGNLNEADFQEITDYFYSYFQKKLASSGIDTVAWSTIAATEFYKSADEKAPDPGGSTSANAWMNSSANKGNVIYGGSIAFAFGKAKKAGKFCEEIGAPAGFFNLNVDFADILLDVDIKTTGGGFYSVPTSRTWKYNSQVKAEVKVTPTDFNTNTLFWNEKMGSEALIVRKDIAAGVNYSDNVSQDVSRKKNNPWAFAKEMNPVVIETTRVKYKEAAKKALEKYADAFVAKHFETQK